MNNKNALDNIRRKTPAARKQAAQNEDLFMPTQQVDLLHSQLAATQQQVQTLQDKNMELSAFNANMVQEVMMLRNTVLNHEQILTSVVNFLGELDRRSRRENRMLFGGSHTATADMAPSAAPLPAATAVGHQSIPGFGDDAPPSPLVHASKLLSEDNLLGSSNLDHMNELFLRGGAGIFTSPPPDPSGRPPGGSAPPSAGSSGTWRFTDVETMVYPIGQTNGIDPLYGDHINNIPFSIPVAKSADVQQQQASNKQKPAPVNPEWIKQPSILLVEDDPVCQAIGIKFLSVLNCHITKAVGHARSILRAMLMS
jgi:hypothetical protein